MKAQTPPAPKKFALKTAKRSIQMTNGEPWILSFDHACVYALEEDTGESLGTFLESMQTELTAGGAMKRLYDFAWFLSAKYRAQQDVEITPAKFRALLPEGELDQVAELVAGIIAEVFPPLAAAEGKPGNGDPKKETSPA